jgi:hypothetical protein
MNLEFRAEIINRSNAVSDAVKGRITEFRGHESGVKRKILLSAALGTVIFGVNWGVIPAISVRESELIPAGLTTGLILGASCGVNIAASLVNVNQERRLLQNENIDMSQDIPATVIFHGLNKVDFLKEKRKGRSIAAVSVPTATSFIVSSALRESVFISLAATSPERMKAIIMLKSAQAASNLVQAGVAEIVLRTKGRNNKEQSLPENAVIVDMKKKL